MDPRPLGAEQWAQISLLLLNLFFFIGVAFSGALAVALAHGIIPSLLGSEATSRDVQISRWVLYPLSLGCLALAVWFLGRTLALAVDVLQYFYPRFLI
ncbi:MAG: hypothetical protein ACRDI2_25020 [Chloroflexota bacterium]